MAQLALEFFTEISSTPRLLYPELSLQLFDECMLHVQSLCQLLEYNATHNAEFYRHNRTALFEPMHALAAGHVAHLREIVHVHNLCNEHTSRLDANVVVLSRLAGSRRSSARQRGGNNATPKGECPKVVSTFFHSFYARIDCAAANEDGIRRGCVRLEDIFPSEADMNGRASKDERKESGTMEDADDDDNEECTDGAEKPIFYSTNMNWVWAEEMDDEDDD